MRSLLVIHQEAAAPEPGESMPKSTLRSIGFQVTMAINEEQAFRGVETADAAILHLPVSRIKTWTNTLHQWKRLPLIWWCGASSASQSLDACEDDVVIDGILTPAMNEREVHWALHFGSRQFYQREQWLEERKQLLARVEERKWIDMAKGILCEIKNISEAEAYEMLRKQAMNERKRMVDVATSIVKVYELLQDSKQKGTKRR
ncbi:ANTAR domain-containing protein [Cohnella sp. CFH 77786]|uniref:ANTAR domain-containing response regulator n=1 Tax=Cohnella sp. CFH 77786 TaxID=2662265 RepID=UPI001C60CB83|nr:ANTAR domain-containing protein [Cohnella sp. CFH 77786]MBW5446341.1 ANTAR domain-containing protein [Cohnella sp. CFH 77786]